MTHAVSARRWRAVEELQSIRAAAPPQSLKFEAADRAVGLALSPARREDGYLVHNAYRDGRNLVLRERRRALARTTDLYHEVEGRALEIAVESRSHPDQTYLRSVPRGAEEEFGWAEAYAILKAASSSLHPRAARVLDGWRDGETVAETAAALRVSPACVKKLRSELRALALSSSYNDMLA